MYEPTYVAFCNNVLTNHVGNFFAEPCAESGWMSMGTTSVVTWEDLGEGTGGLMMDCDNLAMDWDDWMVLGVSEVGTGDGACTTCDKSWWTPSAVMSRAVSSKTLSASVGGRGSTGGKPDTSVTWGVGPLVGNKVWGMGGWDDKSLDANNGVDDFRDLLDGAGQDVELWDVNFWDEQVGVDESWGRVAWVEEASNTDSVDGETPEFNAWDGAVGSLGRRYICCCSLSFSLKDRLDVHMSGNVSVIYLQISEGPTWKISSLLSLPSCLWRKFWSPPHLPSCLDKTLKWNPLVRNVDG